MTLTEAIKVVLEAVRYHSPADVERLAYELPYALQLVRDSGALDPITLQQAARAATTLGKYAADQELVSMLGFVKRAQEGMASDYLMSRLAPQQGGGLSALLMPVLGMASAAIAKKPGYARTRPDSLWAAMQARFRH